MSIRYEVQPGDCLLSLAARIGVPYERIANHPDNQELMAKRHGENFLLPGDILGLPTREIKSLGCATDQRHKFTVKRPKAEIRVNMNELGVARKNEPYFVEVDGKRYEGKSPKTDDDGLVVCRIPPSARTATIVIGATKDRYELLLGHVDPIDTVSGIHGRLSNLGHYDGGIYTDYDGESMESMRAFLAQRSEIENSGADPDDSALQEELKKQYGT